MKFGGKREQFIHPAKHSKLSEFVLSRNRRRAWRAQLKISGGIGPMNMARMIMSCRNVDSRAAETFARHSIALSCTFSGTEVTIEFERKWPKTRSCCLGNCRKNRRFACDKTCSESQITVKSCYFLFTNDSFPLSSDQEVQSVFAFFSSAQTNS